jgi:hypothetical protein
VPVDWLLLQLAHCVMSIMVPTTQHLRHTLSRTPACTKPVLAKRL